MEAWDQRGAAAVAAGAGGGAGLEARGLAGRVATPVAAAAAPVAVRVAEAVSDGCVGTLCGVDDGDGFSRNMYAPVAVMLGYTSPGDGPGEGAPPSSPHGAAPAPVADTPRSGAGGDAEMHTRIDRDSEMRAPSESAGGGEDGVGLFRSPLQRDAFLLYVCACVCVCAGGGHGLHVCSALRMA